MRVQLSYTIVLTEAFLPGLLTNICTTQTLPPVASTSETSSSSCSFSSFSFSGAVAAALSSAEPVEGCPLSPWECETRWSNGWIMYNMFIRSCGSLPAGHPQVCFTLMGFGKELDVVPWWFWGLETTARTNSEKVLGWNFSRQNAAEVSG